MITRIKPSLNLPFSTMGQQNANDAFQNVGGTVTNSNGTRINSKGLIEESSYSIPSFIYFQELSYCIV